MPIIYCGVGRPKSSSVRGTEKQCMDKKYQDKLIELVKMRGKLRGRLAKAQAELKEYKRLDDDAPQRLKKYTKEIKELIDKIPEIKTDLKKLAEEIKKHEQLFECIKKSL